MKSKQEGREAGFAYAVQRLTGCLYGRHDADWLRAFAGRLRETAEQAEQQARWLEEQNRRKA